MTVGILACGTTPEPLRDAHGSYAAMIARLIDPSRRTVTFDVTQGVLPASATACEAYVLTGSSAGVYDDLRWIPPLLGFLRQARGRAGLVGICFGHQAMAQAFGGKVEKSARGWGIGVHAYEVRHRAAWMDDGAHIRAPASHQDQVIEPPPDARTTLSSDFTSFAGLDYGDAISFQFHPEFTPGFGMALIQSRRDLYGAAADPALASYDGPDDRARIGQWINRFLDMTEPGLA